MAIDPITGIYIGLNLLSGINQIGQRQKARRSLEARRRKLREFMTMQGEAQQGRLSSFYKNVNLTQKRTRLLGKTLKKGGSVYGR